MSPSGRATTQHEVLLRVAAVNVTPMPPSSAPDVPANSAGPDSTSLGTPASTDNKDEDGKFKLLSSSRGHGMVLGRRSQGRRVYLKNLCLGDLARLIHLSAFAKRVLLSKVLRRHGTGIEAESLIPGAQAPARHGTQEQ